MKKYLEIKKQFEQNEDKEKATTMAKYMRNLFEFYGVPTPKRKALYIARLKSFKIIYF